MNSSVGTFLIRFSDSVLGNVLLSFLLTSILIKSIYFLGAISISYKSSQNIIHHIYPMEAKDLSIRSLADCLMDNTHLTTLYPNIDKVEAFSRHTSPPRQFPNN